MKNSKRLLILGAGRGQKGLYIAAKKLGYTVIAGTMPGNNLPCLPYADEVCDMDISNPQIVCEKAKTLDLDGAATCCMDTGIIALGRVCDTLGLKGLSEKAALCCNNKFEMKKALMDGNVSTAKYYKVTNKQELEEALSKLEMPVVVKAVDLQGSRGVFISHSKEEAVAGFEKAMDLTRKDFCIVEEFIDGVEFGAQAFIYNGEILFVMPHGDKTYISYTAVPIAHYVPLDCDDALIASTETEVRRAVKAIGLDNCAVNVDLILRNGKVYIIELTGRVGANCLPELVEIYFGIEYYKMIALMAMGESPLDEWNKRSEIHRAGLAEMLISKDKCGKIKDIRYEGETGGSVREVTFFKQPGGQIDIFRDSNDCVGQVIVSGKDMEECRANMDKAVSEIVIDFE